MSEIFPNEVWPADAAVELLDGTTDQRTGLPYIAKGTAPTSVPSFEVQYNRVQQRLRGILAGWRQGMVVDEGGLCIGVYPIRFMLGGTRRSFMGVSGISVPDDSQKVVYLDGATALQVADYWPSDVASFLPLAIVSAVDGQLEIVDVRGYAAFRVPSLEATNVRDRRVLTAHAAAVSGNQADAAIYVFDPAEDLTLEGVQVYCTAVSASASVQVKKADSSVLAAAVVPVAGAVVKPTIADANIAAANPVSVRVTTDGAGSISNLAVTLFFKAALRS